MQLTRFHRLWLMTWLDIGICTACMAVSFCHRHFGFHNTKPKLSKPLKTFINMGLVFFWLLLSLVLQTCSVVWGAMQIFAFLLTVVPMAIIFLLFTIMLLFQRTCPSVPYCHLDWSLCLEPVLWNWIPVATYDLFALLLIERHHFAWDTLALA